VPAFENLANFHELPATGIYVVALPVKICGGSGGPLRIVAKVHADISQRNFLDSGEILGGRIQVFYKGSKYCNRKI